MPWFALAVVGAGRVVAGGAAIARLLQTLVDIVAALTAGPPRLTSAVVAGPTGIHAAVTVETGVPGRRKVGV